MQRKDGLCKGSARSIEALSIHAALESCASYLNTFGGHNMAAGLSCDESNYDQFVEAMTQHVNTQLTPTDLIHTLKIDAQASINELDERTLTTLEQLAPFGAGNPRIRVLIKNARLNGHPEPFGKTGTHLSLRVGDAQHSRQVIRVIGWSWWQRARDIAPGSVVDLVVEPKLSRWNGRARIEPVLCDLRVCENS
jgi:single-stranded-DNA-specific exonuclease